MYLYLDWEPVEQESRGPHGLMGSVRRDGDGWRWRVYHRDVGPDGGDSGRTLRRGTAETIVREVMAARRDEVEAHSASVMEASEPDTDCEVPL